MERVNFIQIFSKPKKTHAEVEASLLKSVINQANTSLPAPIALAHPPSIENLEHIFSQLASKKFEEIYGYSYGGSHSIPKDRAPETSILCAAKGLCVLNDSIPDKFISIRNFINKKILREGKLPDWMLTDAMTSLTAQCNDLTKLSVYSDFWSSSPFVRTYDQSIPENKYLSSIRVNAVIVFANASLKEEDVTANISILYYMGIYYETTSAKKLSQNALFEKLYENVRMQVSAGLPNPSSPTMDDLQFAMLMYQSEQFLKYFAFNFDGPDSCPPDALSNHVYRTNNLLSYFDGDISSFESDVKSQVISLLPPWVSKQASQHLLSAFQTCKETILHIDTDKWQSKKLDCTFSANPKEPLVVHKSGFIWCNASAGEWRDVSYMFIYYFGVFYEIPSGYVAALGDLIRILCNSGQGLLSEPLAISDNPTEDDLDTILITACNEAFMRTFKYQFKGMQTRPLEMSDDSLVFAAQVSFNESRLNEESAAHFVDAILETFDLPEGLNIPAIRADLMRQVKSCFAADTSNDVCISSALEMHYDYDGDSMSDMLSTNALFVYSNASIPDSFHGNTIVEKHLVYYIGVYYSSVTDGGW